MKAAVGLPSDASDWAAELKWDGLRIEAICDGPNLQLRSSTGRDVTHVFPEMQGFGLEVGVPAILDGEIVVFDGDRPSFNRVLQRFNVEHPSEALINTHPIVYIVFDLLTLDGRSLMSLPYQKRRQVLDDLLTDGPRWRVPPYIEGGAHQLLDLARDRQLEGIVVKRLDSIYQAGMRSHDWRKVKIRLRQEFVVGGWVAGQGLLENEMGSLVVGVWEGSELIAAGTVGSGLNDGERTKLASLFVERDDPPFLEVPPLQRRATWVEPTTVVEVAFSEWPGAGLLRHPAYLGIRTDKPADDVVRETPDPGQGMRDY